MVIAAVVLVSFFVALAVTRQLIFYAHKSGLLDTPNVRSSHTRPTPRGGGIGICAGVGAGVAAAGIAGAALPPWPLLVLLAAVAALGYWDDRARGLAASLRMGLQILAAGAAVWILGPFEHFPLPAPFDVPAGLLAWPLSVVWIVGVLNLYNFLDGIDGFAGLQGVIAGLGLAALPVTEPVRILGLAAAAACLGFLRWNWHPARIFMGDVGSTMLGFLYATAPLLLEPERRGQGVVDRPIALVLSCRWYVYNSPPVQPGRKGLGSTPVALVSAAGPDRLEAFGSQRACRSHDARAGGYDGGHGVGRRFFRHGVRAGGRHHGICRLLDVG